MAGGKTVFVLGAGASAEAMLPTGAGLKEKISDLLDIRHDFSRQIGGDREIYNAITAWSEREKAEAPTRTTDTARFVAHAMPQAMSIDNFIDAHAGDDRVEICGKLAIVRSILAAEQQSLLYFDPSSKRPWLDFRKTKETWFNSLTQLAYENCRIDDLKDRLSSIAFVVFNYDRCLEHFLYESVMNYYRIDHNTAAEIVADVEIYHPYGQVGHLHWQKQGQSIGFGANPHWQQLQDLAKEIKTFTEGTDPNSADLPAIHGCIENATSLIVLGFAFHKLNMDLLAPGSARSVQRKKCYATASGISNPDLDSVHKEIARVTNNSVYSYEVRNDRRCAELFMEYWRGLSMSQ